MAKTIKILSPAKALLCSVEIENYNCTILDVKKQIATKIKISPNRQALRLNCKLKDLDNTTPISDLHFENNEPALFLKDLGLQVNRKLVYLMEYFGPLVINLIIYFMPDYFYASPINKPLLLNDALPAILWTVHFAKRILETLFVHRFSHETMPLKNLLKNCLYYWLFGFYICYHINHPYYVPPARNTRTIGLIIFTCGELGNFSTHLLLRNLRAGDDTKERKIPLPNRFLFTKLFNLVSCPHYFYEFVSWIGFTVAAWCLPSLLFALVGLFQMSVWALQKHVKYHKEFTNYPKNRKAIIPFLI